MAVYGYDFYGVGHYGAVALIDYDARPFAALGIDYGIMQLSWHSPSGAWDRLRITRDANGYAPRSDLGQILLDVAAADAPTSFTDMLNLVAGQFYYYTIWVRNTADQTWRRAADTTGLVVKDWNNSERLYELIPSYYRDLDSDVAAGTQYVAGPLERFLSIFGYQLDHIRSEYETLKWVNDPDKVAGGLLPLMAKQWGFGFEQELGMRLARIQCRNAVHMYKLKGTRLGIEAAVSSLTGWAPTISLGINLMLDQNDSSLVQGLGRWAAFLNCAIATKDITIAPTFGPAVPAPSGASTGNVGSGNNVMQMTAIAAGDMEARVGTALGYIVPVTGGTQYTFSGHVYAGATARNVFVRMYWYDIAGNFLSTSDGVQVLDGIAAWTRPTVTAVAPANAYWVGFGARIVGAAAGGIHSWDAFQFEQAAAASAWQSARDVRITLKADRINHVTNPSFETGVAGWVGRTNCNIAQTNAQAKFGTYSMSMTAVAAGDMSASIDLPAMAAGTRRTASAYLRAAANAKNVRVRLQWLDGGGAVLNTATGAQVADATTDFNARPYVNGIVPAGAVTVRLIVDVLAAVAGGVHYVDAVLLESSPVLGDYFSGDLYSPEGEYVWEGTPGASRTHYYARRLIKNYRLNQRLVDFLPGGATYTLIYADASTVT